MPLNYPTETWKTRRKSWLMKCLIKNRGLSVEHLAKILGTSVSYINTKLARDSFSFEDILTVAEATGYSVVFYDKTDPKSIIKEPSTVRMQTVKLPKWSYPVNFNLWFEDTDPEVIARLKKFSNEQNEAKEAQQLYLQKKAELEELKAKYGFKD